MPYRSLIAVVLAATLVLAGCSGGPATQSTTPTDDTTTAGTSISSTSDDGETTGATTTEDYPNVKTENCAHSGPGDDDIVRESGACMPVDADTVYRRVAEMAGVDVDEGPTVRAIPARETTTFDLGFNNESFGATMGIAPDGPRNVYVPGYAQPGRVAGDTVNPAVTMRYVGLWNDTALQEDLGIDFTRREFEITLAHEFLHVLQFYQGSQERLARNLTSDGVNLRVVEKTMIEGSATYFENEYRERYMNESNATANVEAWSAANAYVMWQLGPYIAGADYTRWYLNGSTANFEKLYDEPPVSMEQVLHKYPSDEELPLDLAVRGSVSSDWSTPTAAKTKGELFLRSALRSGVSGEEAAAGAAGWGQDGVIEFQNSSYNSQGAYKYGYGWAIRFDDASEAAEFERVFQTWLEETGDLENGVYVAEDGETYRMVSVSEETVVVLAGHETFTTQATVSGDTTEVHIEHTGSTQTNAVQNDDVDDDEAGDDRSSIDVRPGYRGLAT